MTQPSQVEAGMLIIASDGAEIGRVKEIGERAFKVDAPMQLDYWLEYAHIHEIRGHIVRLDLDEPGVRHHRHADPRDDEPIISPD